MMTDRHLVVLNKQLRKIYNVGWLSGVMFTAGYLYPVISELSYGYVFLLGAASFFFWPFLLGLRLAGAI